MTTTAVGASGTLTLGRDLTVHRMGFGAMQLAGPGVFGPPSDPDEVAAVLRAAVDAGVDHIDTSDFYGPHTVNELIAATLRPYPEGLVLVTKVGARRGPKGEWLPAMTPAELTSAVHDNIDHLGVEALDVVNLRIHGDARTDAPVDSPVAEPFGVLADLARQGLIRHLGLSNVTAGQLAEAQAVAPVVCVQNNYNVVDRRDDALVDECAAQGIAYVPFFPLGGFTPLQSERLESLAAGLGVSAHRLALAWLLRRSDTMLLIPGTSKRSHLADNLAAATLEIPDDVAAGLDGLTGR